MNGKKKVILHLVFDGILFDRTYLRFEEMDKYENRYLLDVYGKNRQLKYIKHTEKLIKVDSLEEYGNVVSNPEVDIIYLHGLWQNYLNAVDYIRQDVVVMWWCYGMDIYENVNRWPPLLQVKLFKPKTHWYFLSHMQGFHQLSSELSYTFPKLYISLVRFYNILKGKRSDRLTRMLSRINYVFTPLESELEELKKRHPFIKAKAFRLQPVIEKKPVIIHRNTGHILFEHSANITNNHLDIISLIKKKRLDIHGRDVYVPLSYGDEKYMAKVQKEISAIDANMHCLVETMPLEEYQDMIAGCTHAIFGMIRQSGLGNISECFQKGIKVFFFPE